jgi:hypothetical protein
MSRYSRLTTGKYQKQVRLLMNKFTKINQTLIMGKRKSKTKILKKNKEILRQKGLLQ